MGPYERNHIVPYGPYDLGDLNVVDKNKWSLGKKLIEDRIRKSCKCNYGKIHNEGSNEEEIDDGHHNIGNLRYFTCKIFEKFSS